MEKAYYDSETKAVITDISGSPSLDEFKASAEPILELMKQHKVIKLLNNNLDLEVNSIENQEWTQKVWFPKAGQLGLKYLAFVVPTNVFGQVSAEQTNEKAEEEGAIEIKYFETAETAKEQGFDYFTSTLLYSKYQNHEVMISLAKTAEKKYNIPFLYFDFREGWKEGIKISKELGLYRQHYCGCIFSQQER